MSKELKILYVIYFIIAGMVTAFMVMSCSNQGIEKGKQITFTPDSLVLVPDASNKLALNVEINVPRHYFSKRSRLFVLPVLTDSDSVIARYNPLVLDAPIYTKKMERKKVLSKMDDPYAAVAQKVSNTRKSYVAHYSDTITLPHDVKKAQLMAIASADGCGECRAISHSKIADVYRPTPILKSAEPSKVVAAAKEPVIIEGRGIVHLQFAINQYDINLKMGKNEQELNRMLSDISPILNDSNAELKTLNIIGIASADGSLKYNTTLARNRANSAKQWLIEHMENGKRLNKIIRIDSLPEGWQPVLDAMTVDGNADSIQVKRILTQYADGNDDVQEKYIRRLPIWNIIKEKYLPKDRKVEYTYTYILRKKE